MENALSLIQSWINESTNKVNIIPRTNHGYLCDTVLGVSEHSVLGTLVNHVGGFSVNNNLLRHFAGENKFDLSVREINLVNDKLPSLIKGALIVADDIYGGLFAINTVGGLIKPGNIMYLPPDVYAWEDLGIGHSDFVHWCICGNLQLFYKKFSSAVKTVDCAFNETLSFTPPLWIKSAAHNPEKIHSKNNHIIRSEMLVQLP